MCSALPTFNSATAAAAVDVIDSRPTKDVVGFFVDSRGCVALPSP
eukprot:SAG31_NODE_460_length_15364_cov_11.851294_21_plen_45_part_00